MKYYRICPECHALVEVNHGGRFKPRLCSACLFAAGTLTVVDNIFHIMRRLDAELAPKGATDEADILP